MVLLVTVAGHAAPASEKQIIADKPKLDAASLELDGPTNLLVLTDVRISTQSGYVIKAGQARTTDANNFNNSTWNFTNKVEITTPDGSSKADTASVSFVGNQISTLHITGNPATFEQHDGDKIIAQGHADNIDYDLQQHTVRLMNNAWVSYGQNECRAVVLVYNITLQRVSANRADQQGERINCTITPASNTETKADSP
ncbi:MAG TPA: lipopolysaccharide transport periplasmic protein LptA [Steroidobacteraceae bacterium]|nr:lipopolysaccharide transport periplasmic protein LptA [Steroidobacteraceae bacterium]